MYFHPPPSPLSLDQASTSGFKKADDTRKTEESGKAVRRSPSSDGPLELAPGRQHWTSKLLSDSRLRAEGVGESIERETIVARGHNRAIGNRNSGAARPAERRVPVLLSAQSASFVCQRKLLAVCYASV